uniref:CYP71AY2-like protein n=1 Tax=Rauvolfia serpentina TaxID=4060 RepID=A0A2H4C2A5_RAUSE|nr:CYP71AY2-like protein [Rauvolfia serpentina]
MEFSFSFPALCILYFLLFFLVKQILKPQSHKKLPPGKRTLPIIGNLHQLAGLLPHRTLKSLSDKHGPLMHLKMGERSAIIVSNARMAKIVLHNHGLAVADRSVNTVASIMTYNSLGVTCAQYGDYWTKLRQIYTLELLSQKKVRSFYSCFEDELANFVESIKSQVGQPIVLYDKASAYLYATICRTIFGSVCKEQEKMMKIAKKTSLLSGTPLRLEDLFPSMSVFCRFSKTLKQLRGLLQEVDDILEEIIVEREKTTEILKEAKDDEDMLSVLLRHKWHNPGGAKFRITNADIKAIIFELILAGTLSVTDVTEWAMVEILRDPKSLKKVYDEVRGICKDKKRVTGYDVEKMEYMHLCVKESTRIHPAAPLLVPRECREDFEVDGYTVPKGAWVLTNCWAVQMDPEVWPEPEKFDPERYIRNPMDFYGSNFELIPFGTGRRGCPGILFGITNAELMLAAMFYHFDWEVADGKKPEDIDMTEDFGAGCIMKYPLKLVPHLAK